MTIEWAPLRIPLHRRLETLSAAGWMWLVLTGDFVPIILYVALFYYGGLYLKTMCILYGIFIYLDKDAALNGGRGQGKDWLRNLAWWKHYKNYCPVSIHKTVDLSPTKNYIFATFPHGLLSTGAFINFCTNATNFHDLFPGIRSKAVTLHYHFNVPFFRELLLNWGMASCSADSLKNMLTASTSINDPKNSDGYTSNAVVLIVGGAQEAFFCKPANYQIILKKRKGFCRIALQTGAPIVPVISFGEVDLFDQTHFPEDHWARKIQNFVKQKTGVAPICFSGRGFFQYSFGLLPMRAPINTVVGAPIEVTKKELPTPEEVENLHNEFCAALTKMFEDNKTKYLKDAEKIKLIIE